MSISIKSVVQQALQEIGAVAWDEEADGSDATVAVSLLNQLVHTLNVDQLLTFCQTIVTHPVVSGSNVLTIGVDTDNLADIKYPRPAFINRLLWMPSAQASPQNIQQLMLSDLLEKQRPSSSIGSPVWFSYNPTEPYAEIHFDVAPSPGGLIKMIYSKKLEPVTINSTVPWPEEYIDLLVYSLALKLATRRQVNAEVLANCNNNYLNAKRKITVANSRRQIPLLGLGGPSGGSDWFKPTILSGY